MLGVGSSDAANAEVAPDGLELTPDLVDIGVVKKQ